MIRTSCAVASKAVSRAEGREVSLAGLVVSEVAHEIHKAIPRKDVRAIQIMIDATGAPDGSRLIVTGDHIAGMLPNGLQLTSAGVDKVGSELVMLLPENPDASARMIGKRILEVTDAHVGVLITDSDGREDKKGATQVAVGVYGLPPLRKSEAASPQGATNGTEETLCDMLAASAGLIMSQRGTNRPAVVIRGR